MRVVGKAVKCAGRYGSHQSSPWDVNYVTGGKGPARLSASVLPSFRDEHGVLFRVALREALDAASHRAPSTPPGPAPPAATPTAPRAPPPPLAPPPPRASSCSCRLCSASSRKQLTVRRASACTSGWSLSAIRHSRSFCGSLMPQAAAGQSLRCLLKQHVQTRAEAPHAAETPSATSLSPPHA